MSGTPYRLIRAGALEPGPDTLVVTLPHETIRGVVAHVRRDWTDVVRVELASGVKLGLAATAMVGLVKASARGRRRRRRS